MSTKDCRFCLSTMDSNARVCPFCRKRQRPNVLLAVAVGISIFASFVAGFLAGAHRFMPKPASSRPTGVSTQPRQTWRITNAEFRGMEPGVELEQVENALGPPTLTWWEEKAVLVGIWANPDNSNLTMGFEPDSRGRFVMTSKSEVGLPETLPDR